MLNNSNSIFEVVSLNFQNPKFIIDFYIKMVNMFTKAGKLNFQLSKIVAKFHDVDQRLVTGLTIVRFFGVPFRKPDSEHMVVVGIKCLTGVAATPGATAWVPGIADALAINGRFSINNGGTIEIKDLPLTVFMQSANNGDANAGVYPLEKPIVIEAQTDYSLDVDFPTAVATATFNMRFELITIKGI